LLRLPRPGRDTVQISDNLRKFIVEDSHRNSMTRVRGGALRLALH
jgi:hypothetical protein